MTILLLYDTNSQISWQLAARCGSVVTDGDVEALGWDFAGDNSIDWGNNNSDLY